MTTFYINKNAQSTGEREMHRLSCTHLPKEENRESLGFHSHSGCALEAAKQLYDDVDGCGHCCPEIHTK